MSVLSICEHGMCFHLFVSSLISFLNVLQFSEYRSFTSLVMFIPGHFIIFEAIVNGIVFLISLFVIGIKMQLISVYYFVFCYFTEYIYQF